MKKQPILYMRYVDDALIVTKDDGNYFEEVRDKLSCVYEFITFSIEREQHRTIPYLHIMLKSESNMTSTTVYRKPPVNYTNEFLPPYVFVFFF